MRNFVFILFLVTAVCLMPGCQKERVTSPNADEQINPTDGFKVSATDFDLEKYNAWKDANNTRLEALGLSSARECMETIYVPADYPTIQEAVDWACDNGSIIVSEGNYIEDVTIYKPGLKLTAQGTVTVFGGFFLDENADGTKIKGFGILVDLASGGFTSGILSIDANNLDLSNNEIVNGYEGMLLWNMSNSKIKNNYVHEGATGILIASFNQSKSDNNKITNNQVSGITSGSGIGLQGDCDENVIQGNQVTNCLMFANAGIFFYNFSDENACNNNIVRNNISSNNGISAAYGGFGMGPDFGNDNIIGPNNTFNENVQYGIAVGPNSYDNTFFKNEVMGNFKCDIRDLSDGMNVYEKNTYGDMCED